MQPLISIVIPLFNREDLIVETLDSIARQTKDNWECIIVDDGSTDNSFEVALTYQQKDKRFKCIKRPRLPKGANTCRNVGADIATGDYVCFLDSDDLLGETFIETRNQGILQYPEKDFIVYPEVGFYNHPNEGYFKLKPQFSFINSTKDIYLFLKYQNPWFICGPIFKIGFIKKFYFNENLKSSQEWDLFVRILLTSPSYVKIDLSDKPDYFVRKDFSRDSITTTNNHLGAYNSKYKSLSVIFSEYKIIIINDRQLKKHFIKSVILTEVANFGYKKNLMLTNLLSQFKIINKSQLLNLVLIIIIIEQPKLFFKKRLFKYKHYFNRLYHKPKIIFSLINL